MNVKLSERNRGSGTLRRSFLQCDRRNLPTIGQWHQFVGDAGTKMPNSCVPTQRCGTHAPGWMQGKHPKKEEGAVYRRVCFHWSGNCCRWSVQIKVRNCNGYYVYKLERPPTCYLRFCGDKGHSEWYWMVVLWVCFSIFCFVPKLFVACGVNDKGQITTEKRMRKWCFERKPFVALTAG